MTMDNFSISCQEDMLTFIKNKMHYYDSFREYLENNELSIDEEENLINTSKMYKNKKCLDILLENLTYESNYWMF